MTKFHRRVVTDGTIFRIQVRAEESDIWTFAPGDFQSHNQALRTMEQWNTQEKYEAERTWTEVKDDTTP